jgi:hypothetical protein
MRQACFKDNCQYRGKLIAPARSEKAICVAFAGTELEHSVVAGIESANFLIATFSQLGAFTGD